MLGRLGRHVRVPERLATSLGLSCGLVSSSLAVVLLGSAGGSAGLSEVFWWPGAALTAGTVLRSMITASRRSRPPHAGHANTSSRNPRAHELRPLSPQMARELSCCRMRMPGVWRVFRRTCRSTVRDNALTPRSICSKHTVIDDQVLLRPQDQCCELGYEVQRHVQDVRRAIVPWCFQTQAHFTARRSSQSLVGYGRTGAVPQQVFSRSRMSGR